MKRTVIGVVALFCAALILSAFQAADTFELHRSSLESPAESADAVTPNDSADVTYTCRALYIGGAGDVKVDTPKSSAVVFAGATAGSTIPIRVDRVYSTDTTATSIVCIY